MQDENLAAGSAAQTNDPSAPAQKGNEGNQGQNALTPEAIKQMIEEAVRPLHAENRRLREAASKPKQDATERTLTERVKAIEDGEKRLAEKNKVASLRTAALSQGVPEDRVDVFVDHVLARKGPQIVYGEDGCTWDQFGDPDSRQPINALFDEVLKAKGDVFKPQAPLPAARGLRANGRGAPPRRYEDIPQPERLKMKPHEREALMRESMGQ